MEPKFFRVLASIILVVIIIAACSPSPAPTPTVIVPGPTEVAPTVPPTPEPTAAPKILTVCLTEEPSSLYIYGTSSRAAWSVLEGIYDGPFDAVDYAGKPVILEALPELKAETVTVQPGEMILDAAGKLTTLQNGMRYLPSGCYDAGCVAVWDGAATVEMEQQVFEFKIKPGITWSDGERLKAQDSVFSFKLASDPKTPVSRWLTDRTKSYTAIDDQRVEWRGIPGFHAQRPDLLFFTPLPEHAYGSLNAENMLTDENVTRKPVGWGAYQISEWAPGSRIVLDKNPNYFRAAEGLPYYDQVIYKFILPTPDGNIAAITTGECDIVDVNPALAERLEKLGDEEKAGNLRVLMSQGPAIEYLVFGIKPAQYDDGYSPWGGDRADFFSDVRVRQAIDKCIDRQAIADNLLERFAHVPASYLPDGYPGASGTQPAFDPAAGQLLLDQAGWKDFDNDPATPRVAAGVATVPDGTPFEISIASTTAPLRASYMQRVADMLRECGLGVTNNNVAPEQLYAPGPDGLVFGRKFDLATISWNMGNYPSCGLFTSDQIPSAANRWLGVNIGGFENAEYDAACASAQFANGDTSDGELKAQQLFVEQLPALPLYQQLNIGLAKPTICGLALHNSSRSLLADIESLNSEAGCQ